MTISQEIDTYFQLTQAYIKPWLLIIGALWVINILNWLTGSHLSKLGIRPRRVSGLIGIPLSPVLHHNISHLLLNCVPLFFLGLGLLILNGVMATIWLTATIVVLGGLGVWLTARRGVHIGASGLISGYFGFIMISAYIKPGVITIVTALVALYYFGGIFFGIFPGKKEVSWESHLFGFLSGIAFAYFVFYF